MDMTAIVEDLDEARQRLGALLDGAAHTVVMTGAGISTESGVPDFRSPDSPWRRFPPIGFQDFMSDPALRLEAWRRKFAMDDLYAGARPSRTHRALTGLAGSGRVATVITQNIDGLQQAAGLPSDRLLELHGNGTFATCLTCGKRHELVDVRRHLAAEASAPECACGGLVKSATIAFGQAMPADILRRAQTAALACDLFIVLGSSLVVQPAASLPLHARRAGARFAIVNREPTCLDGVADLVVRQDVGDVLEPWDTL